MFEKLKDLFRPKPSLSLYQETIARLAAVEIKSPRIYQDFHTVLVPVWKIESYIRLLQKANRALENKHQFVSPEVYFKNVFKSDFFLGEDDSIVDAAHYFEAFVEEASYFLTMYEELENAISQTAVDDANLVNLRFIANNLTRLSKELVHENILS